MSAPATGVILAGAGELALEVGKLLVGVGRDIYAKFSQEDRNALGGYAKNAASLALALRSETDPVKRAQLTDDMKTFENAALLMVVRYEMIAANALEQAGVAALQLAIQSIIKILVASS